MQWVFVHNLVVLRSTLVCRLDWPVTIVNKYGKTKSPHDRFSSPIDGGIMKNNRKHSYFIGTLYFHQNKLFLEINVFYMKIKYILDVIWVLQFFNKKNNDRIRSSS